MDPKTYQQAAARTECNQSEAAQRFGVAANLSGIPFHRLTTVRVNHAVVGLAGEVGELAALVERWIYYGQGVDAAKLKDELGDCLWYIALACNALGLDLADVMEANIRKLQVRFPDKYTDDAAKPENRDRDAEAGAVNGERNKPAADTVRSEMWDNPDLPVRDLSGS